MGGIGRMQNMGGVTVQAPIDLKTLASGPANALEIGKAAEHIACADLILQGYRAYLSDQGLPYDVVVDLAGHLIRVQIKSTCFTRNINIQRPLVPEKLAYFFEIRRRGKFGSKRLSNTDCDIVALVALDIKIVAYLPIKEIGQCCYLSPPGFVFTGSHRKRNAIDCLSFADAVKRLDHYNVEEIIR